MVVPVPMPSWDEIAEGVKFLLNAIDKRRAVKKVSVKKFFKNLEKMKLHTQLSPESEDEIIRMLNEQGRIIEDDKGNLFVLSKSIEKVI
jgi:hypothetical protein